MSRHIDADRLLNDLKADALYPLVKKYGIERVIDAQPTADVRENVRGEWIYWYEKIENDTCTEYRPHCKCSECGTEYDSHTVKFINFCPNCGAKMSHTKEKNHDKSDQSNRCRRA